jgi:hypothetical protein
LVKLGVGVAQFGLNFNNRSDFSFRCHNQSQG